MVYTKVFQRFMGKLNSWIRKCGTKKVLEKFKYTVLGVESLSEVKYLLFGNHGINTCANSLRIIIFEII